MQERKQAQLHSLNRKALKQVKNYTHLKVWKNHGYIYGHEKERYKPNIAAKES
jgi:hypothetical protein